MSAQEIAAYLEDFKCEHPALCEGHEVHLNAAELLRSQDSRITQAVKDLREEAATWDHQDCTKCEPNYGLDDDANCPACVLLSIASRLEGDTNA